jgi:hypothetical protein
MIFGKLENIDFRVKTRNQSKIISKVLAGIPRVRTCIGPYQLFHMFFINFTSQEYISTYQESIHKLFWPSISSDDDAN